MTNSPEATTPDSRLTTTEQEPAEAGEPVTPSDVLDRDTYGEIREPRSASRLPLGDGTWHQLARQYVWVQLISTGVFALIVLAAVLLVTLLAPIAAMLVQAAISRSREFEADRAGAEITGRPMWLASALGQIERAAKRIENYPADANPATAHMFIINPLHGGLSGLFSTHPPTQERIARLRAMAGNGTAVNVELSPVPQIARTTTAPRGPWG